MANVAASANDPIFLNHHAMVDCIFETWLKKNPNISYPINDAIPRGHRKQDYIVPFFPLYKHEDMLFTADHFGYSCEIKTESGGLSTGAKIGIGISVGIFIFAVIIITVTLSIKFCKHRSKEERTLQVDTNYQSTNVLPHDQTEEEDEENALLEKCT